MRFNICVVRVGLAALAMSGTALAGGIHDPDAHYFSFADSPFAAFSLTTPHFWLEDFEDGAMNTPGVSGVGGITLLRNDVFSDSVDADDGVVDNNGNTGGATTGARYSNTLFVLEFHFDAAQLGGCLPTHVGLVMTDAVTSSTMTLAAYRDGEELGSVSGFQISELLHFTDKDRFYGFIDAGGIDRVVMTAAKDNDWAMDHLQYGFAFAGDPDLDGNGLVNGADIAIVLGNWGECSGCPCVADLNGDGVVDGADIAIVLGSWTG